MPEDGAMSKTTMEHPREVEWGQICYELGRAENGHGTDLKLAEVYCEECGPTLEDLTIDDFMLPVVRSEGRIVLEFFGFEPSEYVGYDGNHLYWAFYAERFEKWMLSITEPDDVEKAFEEHWLPDEDNLNVRAVARSVTPFEEDDDE